MRGVSMKGLKQFTILSETASGGVLAAVVVGVIALAALMVLFLMNRQDICQWKFGEPPQLRLCNNPHNNNRQSLSNSPQHSRRL
jgi:hypothetical protein